MKKLRFLLPLLTALLLVGCQDDLGITGDTDFSTNWLGRNADFFVEKMEEAKTAIAEGGPLRLASLPQFFQTTRRMHRHGLNLRLHQGERERSGLPTLH